MSKIDEQSSGKKEGEIRYLTPLNIDTNTKKNIVDLKDQVLSISIIKILISFLNLSTSKVKYYQDV